MNDFANAMISRIPFLQELRSELQMIIVFGTTAILLAFVLFFILNAFGLAGF